MVLGVLFLASNGTSAPAGANAEIRSWMAAQTNLLTWSADFVQTRRLKTLAQPLVSTGRVWFAAPNQFRWEVQAPAPTIAVRSADQMLVIYPRLKRVERYGLAGGEMGQWKDTLALLEAGFPRSEADMERQFKVISTATTNGICTVVLQPKSAAARRMMPQIRISFSTTDHLLKATELEFGDGSTMRNDFGKTEVNPVIEPAIFAPVIGPDFKIVEPLKAKR
jgi:outer membrane lipoprotein-sorting protein